MTIDDAVDKALAVINAKIKRDGETKAVKTKIPTHNVNLNVERDMTPEAMTPDAKSPATGGSEVLTPDAKSMAAG